jgi:hypothetical protein
MKEFEQVRQGLETVCPVWSDLYGAFVWFKGNIALINDNGNYFSDSRCRWIGAMVLIMEYKQANGWLPERYPAGTWTVRIQQTRSGVEFGSYQRESFFKSSAEVLAHVEKYFKGAKARAKKAAK